MREARTSNGWIAWREEGPLEPDAPGDPVVLIMGLGASSRLWYRLLPWLAREHRVILFDNRGTGSSAPVRGRLTMGGLADDAVTVLDAAGVERAHVVGASMGGMIAQHLALGHRERVRSLVLACTTAGGRNGSPPWRLLASAAVRPLLGSRRSFPLVAPSLYAARDPARRAPIAWPRTSIAGWPTRLLRLPSMRSSARSRSRHPHPAVRARRDADHGRPRARGPARASGTGRELAELIPGAHLELIPACGHLLTTDAEEQTAGAILGHLKRHSVAGAGAGSR